MSRLNPLIRLELQEQPKLWQGVLVGLTWASAILVSLILPQMPENIFQFLARFFKMNNQIEMILLNDYLGLYVVVFWVAFFELLKILVIPAEEGYLSLLLTKPLSRRQYLLSKLVPALGSALAFGVVLAVATAGVILLINGAKDFYPWRYLATSVIALSLGVFLVLITQLLLLWFKDTYNAMIIAFALWLVPILPSALFMYRPDIFVAVPWLRWILVFPANLIWLEDTVLGLAVWLVPFLALLSWGVVRLTGYLLEQRDMVF